MVIPHKDKPRENKLAFDIWSIREIAVTVKPRKTKLEAGQEKFRETKADKLQSWQTQ